MCIVQLFINVVIKIVFLKFDQIISIGSLLQFIIFALGKIYLIKPINLKLSGALSVNILDELL